MVVEILSSDAGKLFIPDAIVAKEVLEETRAKNQGRKIPSDAEDSADPSLSGSDDSPPLMPGPFERWSSSRSCAQDRVSSPRRSTETGPRPSGKG